jgi:hypothetical protein
MRLVPLIFLTGFCMCGAGVDDGWKDKPDLRRL